MEELVKILEQIRTVHFTLTIACLALIMATEFSTPTTVQRAHQDLLAIQSGVPSVPETWLDDLARAAFAQTIRTQRADRGFARHIRVALTVAQKYGNFDIPPFSVEGVLRGDFSLLEPDPPQPPDNVIDFSKPSPFKLYGDRFGGSKGYQFNVGPAKFELEGNISRFAQAWDFLKRSHDLVVPVRLQHRLIVGFPMVAEGKSVTIDDLTEGIGKSQIDVAEFGAYTFYQEQGWAFVFENTVAIPAEIEKYPVNLLARFVSLTHLETKPDGAPRPLVSFVDAFPELNTVTATYQQLPLDKARAIIEAELARGGGDFEFLGAKFPAASIGSWGLVILVALEIYFWLHLSQLQKIASREQLKSTSGWVGAYNNRVAQGLTLASTVMFPCWVAFAIGEFGITNVMVASSHFHVALVRLGEATVTVIAIMICSQLVLFWRSANTAPQL